MTKVSPSRLKTIQARRRARKLRRKYQRIASEVKRARKLMRLTQSAFARFLNVSEISVRRWETALGHEPSPAVHQKIKEVLQNGNSV